MMPVGPKVSLARTVATAATLALVFFAVTSTGPSTARAVTPGSQSFSHQGNAAQTFSVPDGIFYLRASAWGGAGGGGYDGIAGGGKAGNVDTVLQVTPGQQIWIYAAAYGGNNGGWGWAGGGNHGAAWGPSVSHSGAGGGGATAITASATGSQVLLVAGGGGGAGGDDENHAWGGNGGNGGQPALPGSPGDGQGGKVNDEGRHGGCGGCGSTPNGGGGEGTDVGEVVGGGGGGGGGGHQGGFGGQNGVYRFEQVDNLGGSGGGGGSSWVTGTALQTKYSVNGLNCAGGDNPEPGCWGGVTLSWGDSPANVSVAGGEGQSAMVTSDFAPISAKVTDSTGIPVPGTKVTFSTPAAGAGGTFPGGSHAITATTGPQGTAAVARLTANALAGDWAATASVAGVAATAKFQLKNTAAPTKTVVTTNPDPSYFDQAVDVSALVSSAAPALLPTGDVQFNVDGDPAGLPVPLNDTGEAALPAGQIPQLDLGDRSITAEYLGDDGHDGSQGSRVQTVEQIPTATELTSAPNPSAAGEDVILTATVNGFDGLGGTPTGSIEFRDGDDLPLGTEALDGNGVATLQTTAIELGSTEISAAYGGDPSFATSTGSLVQSVGPEATATQVSASANPVIFGDSPAFTASVRRSDQGAALDGSVSFELDGDQICAAQPLDAQGQAVCDLAVPPAAGDHSVRALYQPPADSGDLSSYGRLGLVVLTASTRTEPLVDPEPSAFGQTTTLTGTVTHLAGSGALAPGEVSFEVDGTNLGTSPVVGSAGSNTATLTEDCAPAPGPCPFVAGSHIVEAEYSPGNPNVRSSHGAIRHRVLPAATNVTVTSSAERPPANSPVTFTAAVTAAPSAGVPKGLVQFQVDGEPTGEAVSLQSGKAVSLPIDELSEGAHQVSARYVGTPSFAPAEGGLAQDVGPANPDLGTPSFEFRGKSVKIDRQGSMKLRVHCYGAPGAFCRGRSVIRSRGPVRVERRKSRKGWFRAKAGKALSLRGLRVAVGATMKVRFDLTNDGIRVFRQMKKVRSLVRFTPNPGTAQMKPHRLEIRTNGKLRPPKPERDRGGRR